MLRRLSIEASSTVRSVFSALCVLCVACACYTRAEFGQSALKLVAHISLLWLVSLRSSLGTINEF